ncbi:MAG: translation elongation factor 4 [Candidatus Paceibacterota bacterium]|jgi:GTP-binding protein LepA
MNNIRNFVIISHVDHGKSTLADRFLEITKTIPPKKMREQFLDSMDLEREKGITIKMRPCRMAYQGYDLNLIDTPGHVDFSYEVSRSLAAVEGGILLVDATKGIQAQTLSNLEMARKHNLVLIPAINKIDSPQAQIAETQKDVSELLGVKEDEIFLISAKRGDNVKEVLEAVIKEVPSPAGNASAPFKALIFDSKFDSFKGIIAYVRVMEGSIKLGERFYLLQAGQGGETKEVGVFNPEMVSFPELKAGEIGYIATGIKETGKVRVGDTISKNADASPLPGYREPKPVVFASVYPVNPDDFENLKFSLEKLKLNDASFTFEQEVKESLGRGFRCGFLGSLHTEIISERLKREFGMDLIISSPSVVFKSVDQKGKETFLYSPTDWPEPGAAKEFQEPWAILEIMAPVSFMGRVFDLTQELSGKQLETKYFGTDKVMLLYEAPLKGIITGFYDDLKGVTQGLASMDYEITGYRPAELVKLDILVAGKKEEALSKIVRKDAAYREGKRIVERLKEVLPRQLFSVPLQAAVGADIIARSTIGSRGKDVIAPLYGGDYTRKRKLLEKQKKGKKMMKERGRIEIPSKTFMEMFKSK